jgi:hypothetical protein
MSDFLTNLAARAIAQPSLRPRTPSRFEPARAEEAEAPQIAAAAHGPRRIAAARAPSPAAALLESDDTAAAAETPRVEPPAASTPKQERTVEVKQDVVRERIVRERMPAEPEVIERVDVREIPRTRADVVERLVEQVVEQMAEGPERVVRVVERDELEPAAETPALPHRFENEAPRVVVVDKQQRDEWRPSPPLRGPSPRARGEGREAAEATVHVSIGRIEVRATTPPAEPRRPARKPPMSIDEYVARRDTKERG